MGVAPKTILFWNWDSTLWSQLFLTSIECQGDSEKREREREESENTQQSSETSETSFLPCFCKGIHPPSRLHRVVLDPWSLSGEGFLDAQLCVKESFTRQASWIQNYTVQSRRRMDSLAKTWQKTGFTCFTGLLRVFTLFSLSLSLLAISLTFNWS